MARARAAGRDAPPRARLVLHAELHQGSRHLGPAQGGRQLAHALGRVLVSVAIVQQRRARSGVGLVVLRCHHASEPAALYELADRVAARDHRGQAGPEVIEHARTKGEARLEVLVVSGHSQVRVEQVGPALGVGHPARVEVHAASLEPALAREGDRRPGARGDAGRVERRAARAQEDQVHARARARAGAPPPGSGVSASSQRQTPPAHSITRSPAPIRGNTPLQHRPVRAGAGRSGRPNGHHVDEQPERGVGAVAPRVDQARHPHAPEPQVALLLARAHHEVGHRALAEHRRSRPGAARWTSRRRPRPPAPRPSGGCRGRPRSAPACARRSAGAAAAAAGPRPRRASLTAASSGSKSARPASISASGASPTSLGPGAATVTSQRAATALASSSTRIAGPAIAGPTGSAEMKSTRVTRREQRARRRKK